MRIRKNATAAAQDLYWYGRAVTHLKAYIVPGTGMWMWALQAGMHATVTVGGQQIQCVHGSWFFLPWHRAYLKAFEDVVAEAVVREGGPTDWALSYWDYGGNAATRAIPAPFNQNGHPLWVSGRNPNPPAAAQADSKTCLDETEYSSNTGVYGFGGRPLGMTHTGQSPGACERLPHNAVHGAVGGVMGTYNSPQDPLFWLHHANIDRLWEVWRVKRRKPNGDLPDPADAVWRNQNFRFLRYDGTFTTWTGAAMLDTQALDFQYDPDPFAVPVPAGPVPLQPEGMSMAGTRRRVEQFLGGTEEGAVVGQDPVSLEIVTEEPAVAPAPFGVAETLAAPRYYLRLEGVRAPDGIPGTYAAYLNGDAMAGLLPGFGVMEASQDGGPGVTVSLEVTGIVNQLKQEGTWDPRRFRVTLRPYGNDGAPEGVPASDSVTVGKVGLYSV